ncbi:hypothetical protein BDF21DRAFT_456159 [Thamnidium elegans]|nr:hypothetical protein BDF21DRAFT_456159 [Thamnidium elegans]
MNKPSVTQMHLLYYVVIMSTIKREDIMANDRTHTLGSLEDTINADDIVEKYKNKKSADTRLKASRLNICNEERKIAMQNGGVKFSSKLKPSLIMFIGDRGFSFGSSIKGHLNIFLQVKCSITTKFLIKEYMFEFGLVTYRFARHVNPMNIGKNEIAL